MFVVTFTFPVDESPSAITINSVTRSDTGTAADATITGSGTTWQLNIETPAGGLAYAYSLNVDINGTIGVMAGTALDAGISGTYWTQVGVEAIFGAYNIGIWSQKQNDVTTLDLVALQSAGDRTDREINRMLRANFYVAPLASSSADFGEFADQANILVADYLNNGRPSDGENKTFDATMASLAKRARQTLLGMMRSPAGIDCPRSASPAVTVYDSDRQAYVAGYPVSPPPRVIW